MLIIGAGGLALQIIDDLEAQLSDGFIFWSGIKTNKKIISDQYEILHDDESVIRLFKTDSRFILSVGNPASRELLFKKFVAMGGEPMSFSSRDAKVSRYSQIGAGSLILHGAIIEAEVAVGVGSLINAGAIITHECQLGDYTEVAPGAAIGGHARLGQKCFIGTHAAILPNVVIGDEVIIGAGAVVTKNLVSNQTVVGMPARTIKP